MKDLFQKFRGGGTSAPTTGPRLTLAAFGKHPGWDDHLPGIGIETEVLARVKQVLYVAGIGGQIDSGAWEKLEPEKLIPGFEHTFLWTRPGHSLLGQLWSSTDGKGRAKYPMVLCIDGESVSPAFMVRSLLPGLERLHAACRTTTSADKVREDCRSGQEQLTGVLNKASAHEREATPTPELRRLFLERPELGPARLGLLRILHELSAAPSLAAVARNPGARPSSDARATHLRLPLAANSTPDALALWAAFLRCIVPDSVPMLLLARSGVSYLDLIVGEPAPDDFFCLCASLKALPLATEIPYQLAPDLSQKLQAIENKFVEGTSIIARTAAVSPPPPPPSVAMQQAAAPKAAGTPPPVPQSTPLVNPPAPAPKRSLNWLFLVVVVLLIVGVIAAIAFSGSKRHDTGLTQTLSNSQTPAITTGTSTPAQHSDDAGAQEYQKALAASQSALQQQDFSNALAQAQLALKHKPGDAVASNLCFEINQARDAAIAGRQEHDYQAATNAAWLALAGKNFRETTNQAGIALALRPGDLAAARLMSDAQMGFAAAEREVAATRDAAEMQALERQFVAATNAALLALKQGQYDEAARQAATAARLKPNDSAVTELKTRAATEPADLASAQSLFGRGEYAAAAALCARHSGVDSFHDLAGRIETEQKALTDVKQRLDAGDYSFIPTLKSREYAGKSPFVELLAPASAESGKLAEFQLLRQTNAWRELRTRLADPSAAPFAAKQPFVDLKQWADLQSKSEESPDKILLRLDNQFEKMLVWFNVLKSTDPKIKSDDARKEKPLPPGIDPRQIDTFRLRAEYLATEYRKGGWLDQNDRAKNLKKLNEAIRYAQ